MPAQNLRAFSFTGESYDAGPGNVRSVRWPPTGAIPTAQTFVPNINTISCSVQDFTPLVQILTANTSQTAQVGETLLRNGNPYWCTLTFSTNSVSSTNTNVVASQSVAIPPNGLFFIPDNWVTLTGLAAQLYTDGKQAVATNTQSLHFDVCMWG